MGFLKNMVRGLAGKDGVYEDNVAFTVNGTPQDIRAFIKQCTSEPYSAVTTAHINEKDKWLEYEAVKNGTIKYDTASPMSFMYCIEWIVNKCTCSILFQGNFSGANQTSLNIKFKWWCYGKDDVRRNLNIIKEAITDKFQQQ